MSTLLASLNCKDEIHLVIGGVSFIASSRINSITDAGAQAVLIDKSNREDFTVALQQGIEKGKVKHVQKDFEIEDLSRHGREETEGVVDKVFVTLPLSEVKKKEEIFRQCKKLRIPINTADSLEFCTFSLLSSYSSGDFKMGVSTLGKGCKLAARIKRELTNALPVNIGEICSRIGEIRTKIQEQDETDLLEVQNEKDSVGEHDDDATHGGNFNKLVGECDMSKEQQKLQRSRWLSHLVEYFPLDSLASLSMDDLASAYKKRKSLGKENVCEEPDQKRKHLGKEGRISLVGAGPGSVSLLTLGALNEIHTADLVLADKLVPQQVLDIIPKNRTRLFIARKFPGNAEKAQEELLDIGMQSLSRGEKVVRLKQGDPYIFGRGGEEFNFFSQHGFVPNVVPGITSGLSAPVLAAIPPTHRDVADQVLIMTGTGRRGIVPDLPDFVKSRTTVFMMALHRAADLINRLIIDKDWDENLPAAIIERSSCHDQRVIRTTLKSVGKAVEACGSRPPGLLVTGYSCNITGRELNDEPWYVEEGCQQLSSLRCDPSEAV